MKTKPYEVETKHWNMQAAVDAREAVIADVEAFVKKFRRLPQRFVDRKPTGSEEETWREDCNAQKNVLMTTSRCDL